MSSADNSPRGRRVDCPNCKRPTIYSTGNPWRPFCCARCRSIDLGAWATEQYRVAPEPRDEEEDPPAHP
jgi:uncharacterized protein